MLLVAFLARPMLKAKLNNQLKKRAQIFLNIKTTSFRG